MAGKNESRGWWIFQKRPKKVDTGPLESSRNYFAPYEEESRKETRRRVLGAISAADKSAARAGKKSSWYVPQPGKNGLPSVLKFKKPDGSIDVNEWIGAKNAARRLDAFQRTGNRNGAVLGVKSAKVGDREVKEDKFGRLDTDKLFAAADQVSRDNQRRSEISSWLKRLGVKSSKFRSFGGNTKETGASAISDDELALAAKEAREAFGRITGAKRLNKDDYQFFDGALTWEDKKAADRDHAASLRQASKGPRDAPPGGQASPVRGGAGGPWPGRTSAYGVGAYNRGGFVTQGPDGRPIFASNERSPGATNLKSEWQWAEDRMRRQETHDRVTWQLSEEGQAAMQQKRINDAVQRYNRTVVGRRIENGIAAMTALARLGVDLSGQVTGAVESPKGPVEGSDEVTEPPRDPWDSYDRG